MNSVFHRGFFSSEAMGFGALHLLYSAVIGVVAVSKRACSGGYLHYLEKALELDYCILPR